MADTTRLIRIAAGIVTPIVSELGKLSAPIIEGQIRQEIALARIETEVKAVPAMQTKIEAVDARSAETKHDLRAHFVAHDKADKWTLALWGLVAAIIAGIIVYWVTHK